jgi:HAD superfamily hydrolase (TIGR01509 family)
MGGKSVIFDLDGTLIDSMRVWEKIDADFLHKRGLEVPPDYFDAVAPLGFRETANYTIERFSLPEATDDLMREWNEMASWEYGHAIGLKPGVGDYLERLRKNGVRMAIATSSPRSLCAASLANNGIEGYFGAVCTADDVGRGKEFPDIFIYAAGKLSAPPEDCLVFEDNLNGVKSARKAGMSVWGVYDDSSKEHWEEIKRAADGWTLDFSDAPLPRGRNLECRFRGR